MSSPRRRKGTATHRRASEARDLERRLALDDWMKEQTTYLTSALKKGSTLDRYESEKLSSTLWRPTLEEHLFILHQWRKKAETLQIVAARQQSGGSDSLLQAMAIFSFWQEVGFLPGTLEKEKVLQYLKDEIELKDVLENHESRRTAEPD